MTDIVGYLGSAFQEQHKFLKKSNIPMVMVLNKAAMEFDIEPEKFKVFIDAFSNSVCGEYDENTGSGNVKRVKTEGRLSAIATAFAEYFGLAEVHILSIEGGTEEEGESEDDAENVKVDWEELSPEASEVDDSENSEEDEEMETATEGELQESSELSEEVTSTEEGSENEAENSELSDAS